MNHDQHVQTVGDDYPRQQDRIRECIKHGKEIGPAGEFYVMIATNLLKKSEEAWASGDILLILATYTAMREFDT